MYKWKMIGVTANGVSAVCEGTMSMGLTLEEYARDGAGAVVYDVREVDSGYERLMLDHLVMLDPGLDAYDSRESYRFVNGQKQKTTHMGVARYCEFLVEHLPGTRIGQVSESGEVVWGKDPEAVAVALAYRRHARAGQRFVIGE